MHDAAGLVDGCSRASALTQDARINNQEPKRNSFMKGTRMSSIAGISSGSGLDIAQLLRQLAAAQSSSTTGTTASGSSSQTQTVDSENREQKFESTMAQALENLGVSADEVSTIQDEIKAAIASSVQETGSSKGAHEGIKSAIDSVLTEHNLDSEAVQEEFRSIAGPPPGGPPPGGRPGGPGGPPPSGSSTSDTLSTSTDSLIQQLLQSGTFDDSTAQMLQGLLATVDTTA